MRRVLAVATVSIAFACSARAGLVDSFSVYLKACDPSGCAFQWSASSPNVGLDSPEGPPNSGISAFTREGASVAYGALALDVTAGACCGAAEADISANASFSDNVTVFGSLGIGYLSYTTNEHATTTVPVHPFESGSYSYGQSIPASLTFGVPFTISLSVSASAGAFTAGFAETDITYSLASLSVLDASGNPVTDYTYVDDSGALYPFVGGSQAPGDVPPAPEPSSLLLGALGLVVLCSSRLWRNRTFRAARSR